MRLVGHADYQTTANIYTHLKNEHLRNASEKLEDVFKQKVARKLPDGVFARTPQKNIPPKT